MGSRYWWADFYNGEAYSGYLDISEPWNYPYSVPVGGVQDLSIWVVDSSYHTTYGPVYNLGPIYDGRSYVYDCSTGVLSEEAPEVTGEILTPAVEVDGRAQSWGGNAIVDNRYRVIARGRYHAGEKKRTRMYLIVHAPDGRVFTCSDSEVWPYTAPDTEITFSLPTPSDNPLGWSVDMLGNWDAELRYVWVK